MMRILRRVSIRFRFGLISCLLILFVISLIFFVYSINKSLATVDSQILGSIQSQLVYVNQISFIFVIATGVFLFILLIFLYFFSRSLVAPLDNLHSSISSYQIGRNFQLPGEDTADGLIDEIAVFSRSLSFFLENLSQTYSGMELRVSQRTEALTQRALQLQAAAELARDTTTISETEQLLNRAVNLIKDRFGLYFVGVYMVDSDNELALIRAGTGDAGKSLIAQNYYFKVGEVGLIGYVVSSGDVRVVNDVQKEFVYKKNPLLTDTRSQAVFPLKVGSEIIGVLDTHSVKEGFFDTGITSILQIMADQLTVAIQNASLVSDLQARINEARLLYQRYAHDSWSRNRLGDLSRGYEYDILGIHHSDVVLAPEISEKLKDGLPVQINPQEDDKTILYMPLMMYNQVIGYIGLEDSNPERHWTEDEITILRSITNQIALAVDNSRLLEETQLRVDQIRLLQEISAIAASTVKMDNLLFLVAEKIKKILHLDFCDVLWIDPDGLSAKILSRSKDFEDSSDDILSLRFPVVNDPLFQHIFEIGQSIVIHDLLHNPLIAEFRELIEKRNLTSLLLAPLFLLGEVRGFFILEVSGDEFRFNLDDVRLMDQVSMQMSSALEVARSFEETSARADRERKISEVTQRIRETLDIQTILSTATNELRNVLQVPEVSIRITQDLVEPEELDTEAD